ncbi:MAG: metal-binding protein [Candidatus Dactylopiibacterium carminicum]|uniref:Metal-binding protein n=1 Tax=Candidatus Dactylopiibacterium carminicum TaxID=857335 RepID=A0A272EXB4_9RHOO|nr:DUF411 domain-containing protein [Candidatus Dactylopiibacterium carminicum]KAF7600224.1 metal-binding protein [Candidatus Dactylopiibacterium carminicum]PAS94758.1 MAG: metal-binding protein [Candidatus Dactylopiibacterium carminicum]PAS97683.1 MAG: metal-binding protein [Candidatus Dactylopiibacterium carminicum]PAT00220.1 MAG: metal-binding protein [Candidatus Dactylopiibacterium carminicum]
MKKSVMALLLLLGSLGAWAAGPVLEVWKSPYCGCCGKWVEHMQKAGFVAKVHEVQDVSAQRKALGIPDSLGSCHTAKVGGYVLEGHVPAQDVQRLLREKPKAVGLAVPGMPPASPGMDLPMTGDRSYETLLVQSDGKTRRFALHE